MVIHDHFPHMGDFFRLQCTHNAGRIPIDQGIGRNLLILGNDRAGANNAVFADFRIIHEYRTHANEATIPYLSTVNNDIMADENILTNFSRRMISRMNGGIILNISIFTHFNGIAVASYNRIIPNTGPGGDFYLANNCCCFGNKNGSVNLWYISLKRYDMSQ